MQQHVKNQFWQRLNARGDTIVEVMIAIAVISMVLSGAYVTTNKSLQSTRDAQERGTALKLAEGQVEYMKTIATSSIETTRNKLFNTPFGTFCINSTPDIVQTTNAACTIDSLYNISIQKSATDTYVVTVRWAKIGTGTQNSAQLAYKVFKP